MANGRQVSFASTFFFLPFVEYFSTKLATFHSCVSTFLSTLYLFIYYYFHSIVGRIFSTCKLLLFYIKLCCSFKKKRKKRLNFFLSRSVFLFRLLFQVGNMASGSKRRRRLRSFLSYRHSPFRRIISIRQTRSFN